MKISTRTEWPFWALLAAMFLASAIVWPMVPERFPMHYDLYGNVDHWGTRSEAWAPLLIPPVIGLGMYMLLLVLPLVDPGRANYDRFGTAYRVIRFVVLIPLVILHTLGLLSTLGYNVDVVRISLLSMGVLFVVLSSVSGKIRPNWFVGVRTPWTLSSKLSWTHSQRAGGWTFIVLGILTFPAAFLPTPWNIAVVLGALIFSVPGLVVYSYLLWRRDPERVPPSGTTPADP